MAIRLIVGLGNPGDKYIDTRHNAGFWYVDELARACSALFRADSKFHGEVVKINLAGHDVWLLKPMTFMNKSGLAIKSLAQFYKIAPDEILVAHDELDLPTGTIKLKKSGGHGGHNGLRDTIAHCGKGFYRLRIGVDHPGHKSQVVDYVLKHPSKADKQKISMAIDEAVRYTPEIIQGEFDKAMHALHSLKPQ